MLVKRCRTVFDVNIEAFQKKPWRQRGVDLTDYFNFGLDEQGWRKYCFGMVGSTTLFLSMMLGHGWFENYNRTTLLFFPAETVHTERQISCRKVVWNGPGEAWP
jgi:hypothetical protein